SLRVPCIALPFSGLQFRRSPLLSLFFLSTRLSLRSALFPYTTLFRSYIVLVRRADQHCSSVSQLGHAQSTRGQYARRPRGKRVRSEEHTSELQSLTISYAVFCLKKKRLPGERGVARP